MYKQTHIYVFMLVSISLHMILLYQYQIISTPVYKKNNRNFNIELYTQPVHPKKTSNHTDIRQNNHTKKKQNPSNKSISSPAHRPKNLDKAVPVKTIAQQKTLDNTNNSSATNKEVKRQQTTQANNKENIYLQKILTVIENNKYYPSTARRRNMQGVVSVRFNLLHNGEIEDIEISGKYKILQLAARAAILDSLPFHRPPDGITLPLRVNYSMAFKLK